MISLLLIAAASSVTIFIVLYKYVRPKFPIKVECWFCEKVTVVPYGNKNCWDCPGCEQYNGFREDGHYNKPIPAQYNESINYPVNCKTDEFISKDSLLCDECNQNQLLKVRQLAAFVPFNENKYDAEVEAFEQHLERVYRLCDVCQRTINMELDKQDHVLGTKLDQVTGDVSKSSEKSFVEKVSPGTKVKSLLYRTPGVPLSDVMATMSSVCALTLCITQCHILQQQLQTTWLPMSYFLPVIHLTLTKLDIIGGIGILTCFLAKLFIGKNRLHVLDAVNIPLWLLTLLVDGQFGQIVFGQGWTPVISSIHHGLNAVTGILCLLVTRRSRSCPNISMKRLSLDNSRSSRRSDSTLIDSSPLQSVSEAGYSQVYDNHMSSKVPHQSDRLDDALSDLGSFSIGSASLKRSASGIFGCSSFTTGQPVSMTGFSFGQALQDRHNRPLISPAKLRVSHTGGWSAQNRADNPFLQAKRETSMFKVDSGTSNFNLGNTNQTPNIFSDKTSIFNDNTSFKGDNPGVFDEKGSCFSGHLTTPVSKSHFNDHGSTVSGRFSSCNDSVRKSWSVRNHAINKMEDFHDDKDSRSTVSSVCPVDSTTKTEAKATAFWKSSGFIGFVLGASFVVNVFLTFNSWNKPS